MLKEGRDEKGRFKKGFVTNPTGRPKDGTNYADALKRVLAAQKMDITFIVDGEEKRINVESKGKTFYEGIASVQVMEALKGNIQAVKEIMNRVEGMPKQTIEQTNIAPPEPTRIIVSSKKEAEQLEKLANG